MSVSTCAAKVRASLKARSHCPVAEILTAVKLLILAETETDPAADPEISEMETRISAGVGKIDANNWFLSMTWGKGADHLPISCQIGSQGRFLSLRLFALFLLVVLSPAGRATVTGPPPMRR
jgi:hypothetical protein